MYAQMNQLHRILLSALPIVTLPEKKTYLLVYVHLYTATVVCREARSQRQMKVLDFMHVMYNNKFFFSRLNTCGDMYPDGFATSLNTEHHRGLNKYMEISPVIEARYSKTF